MVALSILGVSGINYQHMFIVCLFMVYCFLGNLDYGSNWTLPRQDMGSNLERSEYGYNLREGSEVKGTVIQ